MQKIESHEIVDNFYFINATCSTKRVEKTDVSNFLRKLLIFYSID